MSRRVSCFFLSRSPVWVAICPILAGYLQAPYSLSHHRNMVAWPNQGWNSGGGSMDLYSIALFVHIVGAVLIFVALTIEGVSLRVGFSAASINQILGPISAVAVLVPGAYMMWAQVGWSGWVAVGIVVYVLIAAGGAFTGINVMRGRMSSGAATVSWLGRVGNALRGLFVIAAKPKLAEVIVSVVVAAAS